MVTHGGTARLVRDDDGRLVVDSDTVVTDEIVLYLIDLGREGSTRTSGPASR